LLDSLLQEIKLAYLLMAGSKEARPEAKAVQSQDVGIKKMHKKKKLIDSAAPKAPPNCYILYLNEHREAVKAEMEAAGGRPGSVKSPELASELGRRWRLLSSEDKLKYENMFKQKMKEFQIAKSTYKPSEEFMMKVKLREEEENLAKQKARAKASGMMKAYFDFVATNWTRVALANQRMSPGEMQKLIWSEWMGGRGGKTTQDLKKVRKRKRSGEKKSHNSDGLKITYNAKIDEKVKDTDVSSDPNPSVCDDDDVGDQFTPKKVAKACHSPPSAKHIQSQSSPNAKVCQTPSSANVNQSPPTSKVCQSPPSAKICQSPPSVKVCQAPPSAKDCQSPHSAKVGQSPHSAKVCQSPHSAKVSQSPPSEKDYQSPPSAKVCKSPARYEQVTITRQGYQHQQPTMQQEQEKAAFALFQSQMLEELKRVCPQMVEDDMVKSVKEKWAEIPRAQRDIFYREIMQSQMHNK